MRFSAQARLAREPGSGRHAISLIGPGPDFSPAYAMTTDPDEPVILATLAGASGEPTPLLIDGCALPNTVHVEVLAAPGTAVQPVISVCSRYWFPNRQGHPMITCTNIPHTGIAGVPAASTRTLSTCYTATMTRRDRRRPHRESGDVRRVL